MPVSIRHRLRGAAVTAAAAAATAGVALAAPAAAGTPDSSIIVHAASERTSHSTTDTNNTAGTVSPLDGVEFEVTGPGLTTAETCVTGASGQCTLNVPGTGNYVVRQIGTPAGYFPENTLGVGLVGPPNTVAPADYNPVTVAVPTTTSTIDVPAAATNNTGLTARTGRWVLSRDNPGLPDVCGLHFALLFDLSSSINAGNLTDMKNAAKSFARALQGTPSSVSLYTFGTGPSPGGGGNSPSGELPTLTPGDVTALQTRIDQIFLPGAGQYTDWDAGIYQMTSASPALNEAIVLTDGDPTRYGPSGQFGLVTPVTTRFREVENGIFSANALKSLGTRIVGVGIDEDRSGSIVNLSAISGTRAGSDYFETTFGDLTEHLEAQAVRNCAGLSIEKTASPSTYTEVGQAIHYTYRVTNTGSHFTLSPITVTDDHIHAPSTVVCEDTSLEPGQSTTCHATYHITQADVDRGHVTNVATARGETENGTPVFSEEVEDTVHLSAIHITKEAYPTEFGVAGERITYTFVVTNTGETALNPVIVHDDKLGPIICPRDELGAHESMTCEFIYTTSEEDVRAGAIHNVVTVTGHDPEGRVVTDDDEATVTRIEGPGIQLEKVAFPTQYAAVGEVITFTYRVVNTGAVTLHDVALTDSRLGEVTCPSSVLEPGQEMDCTGQHTITAADIAAGHLHNVATVTGRDEQGRHVSDDDDATVTAIHAPGIQIEKSSSPGTFSAAGQTVHYTYRVANTGNVTLHNVTVTDSRIGTTATCASTTLAPGEETTCTATYITTPADVARGYIPNFAFARGDRPDGSSITSARAEAIVTGPAAVPVTG